MQNNKLWFQSLITCQMHCQISSNVAAGDREVSKTQDHSDSMTRKEMDTKTARQNHELKMFFHRKQILFSYL